MIVIVSPLRSELIGALKALPGRHDPLPAPAPGALFQATPGLVLGWSGVGRGPTERLLARIAELEPDRLLHLGVAGALRHGLVAGDAFAIDRVCRAGEAPLDLTPEPGWLAAWGANLQVGGCVTVDAIADTPASKAALAQAHPDAALVEMETWWAVSAARAHGLTPTCVRVVCDRLDQTLPDLSPGLDAVGRPRPLAFAKHLLRRPSAIAKLPSVAGAFSTAERRLRELIGIAANA